MPKTRELTAKDRETIIRRKAAGVSNRIIAKEIGFSEG
jgi:IS30 family transposase